MADRARDGDDDGGGEAGRAGGGWRREGRDLLAAVAAGSIVGLPLLYTMEMWWRGASLPPGHLAGLFGAAFVVNFAFNLVSGFRRESGPLEAASETVTAVGVGFLYSLAVLWLIGEIGPGKSLSEVLGKALLQTLPVSLGVSFANAQIRGRDRTGEDEEGEDAGGSGGNGGGDADSERKQARADLRDAAAAMAGSVIFALNVAPTDEIVRIAARLSPDRLLLLLGVELLVAWLILFASGFREHEVHVKGLFQHPFAEVLMTVAISLLVSYLLLRLLGEPSALAHPESAVAMVVVLGVPAVAGGAAGRLVA